MNAEMPSTVLISSSIDHHADYLVVASACVALLQSFFPLAFASSSAQNAIMYPFLFANRTIQATRSTSASQTQTRPGKSRFMIMLLRLP
jgi:hypothetical protein